MSKPSNKQLAVSVDRLISSGQKVHSVTGSLAAYLIAERRTKDLDAVMRALTEVRAKHGTYEAEATSAHTLDEQIVSRLKQLITSRSKNVKKIALTQRIDKQLVGGVRLDTSEFRLDTTIKNRLKQLTATHTNGA